MDNPLLYLFGAFGALIYSFPVYLVGLSKTPPARFALQVFIFSVVVGSVFAPAFVPMLGSWKPYLIFPSPYPLAIGIGLAANPVIPIILSKITDYAERYSIGSKLP